MQLVCRDPSFERGLGSKILSCIPVALASRLKVDRIGLALPPSRRAMVDCEVPHPFGQLTLGEVGPLSSDL
jgi:hypothetical protein